MKYRFLSFFLLFPFIAFSQTTYTNFDDFEDAIMGAVAGDEIILQNGVYEAESMTLTDIVGTEENPIIIRAEEVGGVTLNNDLYVDFRTCAYITFQGFMINLNEKSTTFKIQASNNIRITQNVFDGIAEPAYKDNDTTDRNSSTWISIQGKWDDDVTISNNNRVDHNIFKNKVTLGNMIRIDGTNSTQVSQYDMIDHNYFLNMGPRADNEMEAIRIGWSAMSESDGYCTVTYNLFEACNGDPEIISVKCNKNVISHNTFRACQGTLSLRHGNQSLVDGNYFFGEGVEGSGGVRIYGSDHVIINNHFQELKGTKWDAPITLTEGDVDETSTSLSSHYRIERALIACNTLAYNDFGIEIGYDNVGKYSKPARDVVMAYNLVVADTNSLVNYINAPDNMSWINNLMYTTGDATLATNASFSTDEVVEEDPHLVYDNSTGCYYASAQTPRIVMSDIDLAVAYDIEGQVRLSPSTYGADEHSSTSVQYYPLTISDVGPNMYDYLEVSRQNLAFIRMGNDEAIRISSNLAWSITSDASWLSLSHTSGVGDETLEVVADENTTGAERSTSFTITTSGAEHDEMLVTVNVSQQATDPDTLLLSQAEIVFDNEDFAQSINVTSNLDWTCSCSDTWFNIIAPSNNETDQLTIEVEANNSVTSREGAVYFTVDNEIVDSLIILQEGQLGSEEQLSIIQAIASTEQNEDGKENIASNLIDASTDNRWSGEGIGAYVDFALPAQCLISYVKVGHYKGDERTSSFHLLAWNHETESFDTLLYNITSDISDEVLTIYDFDEVTTDTIRLVGLGYSNGSGVWNSYTELELWGWSETSYVESIEALSSISLYPNPSSNYIIINNAEGCNVEIFDINGASMVKALVDKEKYYFFLSLDLGMYYVVFSKGIESWHQALLIH